MPRVGRIIRMCGGSRKHNVRVDAKRRVRGGANALTARRGVICWAKRQMSAQQPRIFTCTPFAFHANGSFFGRDTGLICKSLQALGAESRVVLPLPHYEDDLEDAPLLRVEMRQLRSAAWWRAQRLDGVILYSWGDPRYTGVARAIHHAGIRLVIHYDANSELHEHLKRTGVR